ncbi:hypothetical protein [Microvirga lotononidis]|uniref:Uncharacterized protein n=1 Tax=Microvirga lotononidis TaxID=864069 RepID=I4YMW5_9HYPH|nr:hypothetical protein [Microvirga lotononidis]EIM25307.1 hypothetical protein MicloDRAFT_00060320 [Microvirga lotononidis]WQO29217.1 hypothetical protein U0023_09190 [Microvirga lotononidis]
MATSKLDERRLMTDEEYTLVEQTRYPVLGKLEDAALKDLTQRLRERRDRARDIAHRQRREVRGKGRRTTAFEKQDAGNRRKARILAEALTRINSERTHRKAEELRANARRAFALRQDREASVRPDSGRTSRSGMREVASSRRDRIVNPMDAGRISQAGKRAQAVRDNA